jgi:hypothetical protein
MRAVVVSCVCSMMVEFLGMWTSMGKLYVFYNVLVICESSWFNAQFETRRNSHIVVVLHPLFRSITGFL